MGERKRWITCGRVISILVPVLSMLVIQCVLPDPCGAQVFNMQRGNKRIQFNAGSYSVTTDQRNPEIQVTAWWMKLYDYSYTAKTWADTSRTISLHVRSTRGTTQSSTYYQMYDVESNYSNDTYIRRYRERKGATCYAHDTGTRQAMGMAVWGYRRDIASWKGFYNWRPNNSPEGSNSGNMQWHGWSWRTFNNNTVRKIQIRTWVAEYSNHGNSHQEVHWLNGSSVSLQDNIVDLNMREQWGYGPQWSLQFEVDQIELTYSYTATYYYSVTNAGWTSPYNVVDMGAKGLYWGKIWWSESYTNGSNKRARVYVRTSTSASSGYGSWIEVYNGAPLMKKLTYQSESHEGRTFSWQKRYMQIYINMYNPASHYQSNNRPYISNMYVDYFYDNSLTYPWRHYKARILWDANGSEGMWAQRSSGECSNVTYRNINIKGIYSQHIELTKYDASFRQRNSNYDISVDYQDMHVRTTLGGTYYTTYNAESYISNPMIRAWRWRKGTCCYAHDTGTRMAMGVAVFGYRRDIASWRGYYTWRPDNDPEGDQGGNMQWRGWNWTTRMPASHKVSRLQIRSWVAEYSNHGNSHQEVHWFNSTSKPNGQDNIIDLNMREQWGYGPQWSLQFEISHMDVEYDSTYKAYRPSGYWVSGTSAFDAGSEYYKWAMITYADRDRSVKVYSRVSTSTSFSSWSAQRSNYYNLDAAYRYLQLKVDFDSAGTGYPGPGTSAKLDWICAFYGTNRKPYLKNLAISNNIPSEWDGVDKRSQINYSNPAQAATFATWNPTGTINLAYETYDPDGDACRTYDWEYKCDTLGIGWTDIPDNEKGGDHGGYRSAFNTAASPYKKYTDLTWNTLPTADGFYGDLTFRFRIKDELSDNNQENLMSDYSEKQFFCDNNEPPVITAGSFQVLPDPAYTTDTLYVNTSMSASDSDSVVTACHAEADLPNMEYRSSWTVGGQQVGDTAPELAPENYVKGDTVRVEVFPFDGKEFGQMVADELTISNKPPVITKIELTPSQPYTTDDMMCTVVSSDDDEFIWRNDDLKGATVNANQDPSGYVDGNVITTDVDGDNEWELQLR